MTVGGGLPHSFKWGFSNRCVRCIIPKLAHVNKEKTLFRLLRRKNNKFLEYYLCLVIRLRIVGGTYVQQCSLNAK